MGTIAKVFGNFELVKNKTILQKIALEFCTVKCPQELENTSD